MSNEPSRPADDASTGGDPAARPAVPPADADRIAASQDAAAAAEERELTTPASTGLGSGPAGGSDTAPEPGEAARAQPVTGNEPVTPAGPTAAPDARPVPDADGAGKKPGSGGRTVLIGVLVLLAIGLVAYGVWHIIGDRAAAEAGDCVSVTSETDDNRAEVDKLDCGADRASYKVGKVLEASDSTCPEDGIYTEIVPAGSAGDGYRLCLLPNMAEGACYKPDEGSGFARTECTGPETIKVTKVIQGSTDLAACPDGAGMAYPEPAVTYCLEPAEM